MANNRELSQFASFVEVNDTSRHISVASTSGQYVGIGSTQPTVKVDIVGDVKVSGSFTAPSGSIANLNGTNLYYTGLSTVGNFRITPAGVGATVGNAGIVTYYGDGRYLDLSANTSGGIGIQTGNTLVGYGVTFIEFRGPGVSTGFYNAAAGIATVYFQGGGGGGGAIGIGSTFPGTPLSVDPAPSNGDLFFHIDYGRTFIYYDEVILGVGSSAFWIDSAPFNIGIITALSGGVAFDDGTALLPSWYFVDDQTTGVFSPVNGELTFVSTGSSVLNVNSDGIVVTGVTTSTKANIGAATTFPEDLVVQGDARVTGILTVGTSSLTLNGNTNQINGVTISSGILTATTINASTITGAVTGNATGLTGTPDIAVRNITGVAATFTGNVSIAGTLTYEDVTNVDSIGIVTARSGLRVTGSDISVSSGGISVSGVATASSFSGSGANLTSLNASNLSSGTVPDARFPATLPAASGANLTSLNANNISSGTLAIARGGTNSTSTPTAGGAAYGTGSAFAFTSAGTSGQVLTSNGTSAPTWADAGGGAWEYISSVTASGTTVEFTSIDSTYKTYVIQGSDFYPAGVQGQSFCMRTSSNNGSSYDSSSGNYQFSNIYIEPATPAGGAGNNFGQYIGNSETRIDLTASAAMQGTGGTPLNQMGGFLTIYLHDPSNTSRYKLINGRIIFWKNYDNTYSVMSDRVISGNRLSASAINAVRFYWESGASFGGGTFHLYGLKTS